MGRMIVRCPRLGHWNAEPYKTHKQLCAKIITTNNTQLCRKIMHEYTTVITMTTKSSENT